MQATITTCPFPDTSTGQAIGKTGLATVSYTQLSYWHETAKDCGVKPEHADFIGKNLLLFVGNVRHLDGMQSVSYTHLLNFGKNFEVETSRSLNSLTYCPG